MKRDSRLRLDTPEVFLYREQQKALRRELDESVSAGIWRTMISPLVNLILSKIRGAGEAPVPEFPADGDARFKEVFESARALIIDFRPLHFDEHTGIVLVRRVAAATAIQLPADVGMWMKAATLFEVSEDWASFRDSIPVSSIESKIEDLIESPANLQECFHSADVTPEHLVSGEKQPAKEMWERVDDRSRLAELCFLAHRCKVSCELLYRSSVANWSRWLANLPHPVIQMIAMDRVSELDYLEAVLKEVLGWHPARTDDLFLLALVRRILDLWTEIERSFEKTARERPDDAAAVRKPWESTELPARIERVVALLGESDYGVRTAAILFERLSPFQGALSERIVCLDRFRIAILTLFVGRGVDWDTTALFQHPSVSSLTSAAALASRLPSEKGFCSVLKRYQAWLIDSKHIWYESFKPYDEELLASLAAVLAKSDDPVGKATRILDAVREPSQGWKASHDRWLQSLPKTTHAVTMIALAACDVVDREGRGEKSADLMGLAWREFHAIIEGAPVDLMPIQIRSPLAYIWGCAGRVLAGGDDELSVAMRMLEDPELVLVAAQSLEANGGLSDPIKNVVREQSESLLAFFHHVRNFANDKEGPMRRTLAELMSSEPHIKQAE